MSPAVYAIPLTTRFRGITVREGLLLEGPAGWGEFCPFPEYDDVEARPWLAAAREAAELGWPDPVRDRVPVNCIVPAVGPDQAQRIVRASGCRTAKIKVADQPGSLPADLERVAAVRDALGPGGAVRVDANGRWSVDEAVAAIRALDRAAGGLQYVEQPCAELAELAVAVAGAADVAVLKCAPLGGVRRALAVAQACGLPCVVSSALQTSVGLAAEVALAGALPDLQFACGLGTGALLAADVVAEPLQPTDGWLEVPRRAPEPVLRDAYAADPDRARWWYERLARVAGGSNFTTERAYP